MTLKTYIVNQFIISCIFQRQNLHTVQTAELTAVRCIKVIMSLVLLVTAISINMLMLIY